MDYEKLYNDMQSMVERLEDEEVGVHFGSSEYKNAKNACISLAELLRGLKEKGKDYQMTDSELEQVNQQMQEVSASMDTYLDKKNKEEVRKGQLSTTSYYRVEAMKSAKKKVEEQRKAMDDLLVERGLELPTLSNAQLENERKLISEELADAQKNVHLGSKEYQNAQEEYEKLNNLWSSTMDGKGAEDLPSAGEIETLRATVERTRKSVDEYLLKKADAENPGPKTQKRIAAMKRAQENLDVQARKLEEWESKLAKQEPEKNYNELATNTRYLMDQMEAAEKGVFGGSNEYKEVKDLLKQQEEKWKEIAKKGADYKMSPDELKEMVELNQKMEKAVDKYIENKAGQEIGPKTQKRLRVMQKVKDHARSQQRKFEARRDEMLKEVEGLSNEQVQEKARDTSREIRNADRRVFFGSRAYSNAMKSYNRSLNHWEQYKEKEAAGKATPKERTEEKKALEANIKEIDRYLDTKKNKNLDKNPKTKKRVEAMQKARKNLETRMRRIELAEKRQREKEREQRQQQLETRKKNLQLGAKSQQALERNMSRASLAATRQLTQLGNHRTLSEMDKRNARMALATLVLEDKLRQPGNEQLKLAVSKGGKNYSNVVKSIANSKEFREAFPDRAFTPANCRNLAKNPAIAGRYAREFNNRMVQKAQAKRQLRQQATPQRQNVRNNDMRRN